MNLARSTAGLVPRRLALAQFWLFWVAPLAGAVISGFACKWLGGDANVAEIVNHSPSHRMT